MEIMSNIIKFIRSKHKLFDLSSYFHLPYVLAYPNRVSIEITNLCNLKCPVCESSNISLRKKGVMSFENFKKIMDELGPHLDDLELHNWGESFLSKDIYRMFYYVRKVSSRCYVYIDTNGHFIDTNQLFASPPDELVFSIDGLDQEIYEKYRVKGSFDKVLNNLKSCIGTKHKLKIDKPKIVVKFICMKHNEHQLKRFSEFVREINADDYRIEAFTSRTVKHAKEFMSTLPAYQKYNPEELKREKLVPYMKQLNLPCPMVWRYANIYWNGDVPPCCTDYDGIFTWGNIFEEKSFWKVWNGKKAQAFRKLHRICKYRNNLSICKECYLANYILTGNAELEFTLEKAGRSYKTHYEQVDSQNIRKT